MFAWFQKSDVFTEGEEELEDETTVNGAEEDDDDDDDEVGEEEEDHDKSIEFRSEVGSSGKEGFRRRRFLWPVMVCLWLDFT